MLLKRFTLEQRKVWKRRAVTHDIENEVHVLNLKGFINPQINKYYWSGMAGRGEPL